MKIYGKPILHARTYNHDYLLDKLLVVPNELFGRNALLHKFAIESTANLELYKQGRKIVIGFKDCIAVGRAVSSDLLYSEVPNRPKRFNNVDHADGRNPKLFVGIMIRNYFGMNPFAIPDNTFLDIYETAIESRWLETTQNENWNRSLIWNSDINIDVIPLNDPGIPELSNIFSNNINQKQVFSDNYNEQIYYYALREALKGRDISFCSDLKYQPSSEYKIITNNNPKATGNAGRTNNANNNANVNNNNIKYINSANETPEDLIKQGYVKIPANIANIIIPVLSAQFPAEEIYIKNLVNQNNINANENNGKLCFLKQFSGMNSECDLYACISSILKRM